MKVHQAGFTLLELMISVTISVFLIGGAISIVQSTRSTFGAQKLMSELQDNQRLALTFMAEVIESAGYFPNPKANASDTVLPLTGVYASASQSVYGTRNAAAPGDTVTVRFAAGVGDNVFSCTGSQNTATAPYDVFNNKFYVKTTGATSSLYCTSTTAGGTVDTPLVNNVSNLQILYGVKLSGSNSGSCTDTYLRADQMIAAYWMKVCSLKVTLTFINPTTNPASTINVSRIIAVMNNAGVNT